MDENGDYTFGRRDEFLRGREAVAQAILTRLRLLLAEWWEDTEDGLPLFEKVLSTFHGENPEDIDLIFSDRILGTPNVTNIERFDSSFDLQTRTYSASCLVDTVYGQIGAEIGGPRAEMIRVRAL